MRSPRLLLIGIDGASHGILSDLIARGEAPNLARIGRRGVSGVLQSTFPPHTAPGWTSMFTGVNPGEHGLFQFWRTQSPSYAAFPVHSGEMQREPIWQILERQGVATGVYNVPMTHPPTAPKDGYMISWPLSPTLRYADPPGLISELAQANLHHHSDLVTMYTGQEDYCEQAVRFIKRRTETCIYLQKTRPVDALFVVFTEIDRVSHHYWGKNDEPSDTVLGFYHQIDEAVGELLSLADRNTVVVVASDHGFGLCRQDFNVHAYLEAAGLFAITSEEASEDIAAWHRSEDPERRSVDWSRTAAYMPTPGCFGLNINLVGRESRGSVPPNQVRSVETDLRTAFAALLDGDGVPYFELVSRDQVYAGIALEQAPDYLLVPKRWDIMPAPSLAPDLWLEPSQQAVHRPDGIFLAAGPTVPQGCQALARIEDVTPFVLVQLGLPVPERLDGHWLFEPSENPLRELPRCRVAARSLTDTEKTFMDQRLSEIGYL